MIQIVSRDTSPPLYYLSEHFWFKLFGSSEMAIRSLSFLFHLGTALTLALIAKHLWDKKTAIWALILGFLNPFLFTYSFEGRMYALLAFTTTLSFYGFLKGFFIKNPQIKWKLFYAVTAAFALYSHHFAIFAIAIQGFWVLPLIFKPSQKKGIISRLLINLWPFGLTALFYLPWLPALYYQTSLVAGDFWLATPNFNDLLELVRKFLVGAQEYPLRSLALALVGVLILIRRGGKDKTDGLLFSWFLGPLMLTWLVSQVMQSIFFDRYLLFTIPGLALILASRRRVAVSFLGLVFLVTIFTIQDWHYFTHPTKRPFRDLAAYVKQAKQPEDKLINWNSAAHHLWETKYYDIPAPIYSPEGPLPFYVGTAQMTEDDVIFAPPETQRLGVITSGPVEEVAIEGFKQTTVKPLDSLKVIWLEKTE